MNTDVVCLTAMMDILTGPIPAAFADEFSIKEKKINKKTQYAEYIYINLFIFWGFRVSWYVYSSLSL